MDTTPRQEHGSKAVKLVDTGNIPALVPSDGLKVVKEDSTRHKVVSGAKAR